MSMWTDWFIADEAEAIRATVTDGGPDRDDWPNVELPSITQSELMALHGVLRGTPGEWADVTGEFFVGDEEPDEDGGMTCVFRVSPEFIRLLADVPDDRLADVAAAWHRHAEDLRDWSTDDVRGVLGLAVGFARRAEQAGKPVLELSVT